MRAETFISPFPSLLSSFSAEGNSHDAGIPCCGAGKSDSAPDAIQNQFLWLLDERRRKEYWKGEKESWSYDVDMGPPEAPSPAPLPPDNLSRFFCWFCEEKENVT